MKYRDSSDRKNAAFVSLMIVVFIVALILSFMDFSLRIQLDNQRENEARLEEVARNNVDSVVRNLNSDVTFLKFTAEKFGELADLHGEKAENLLKEVAEQTTFIRMGIDYPDCRSITSDGYYVNVADMNYMDRVLNGETVITNVMKTKVENANCFAIVLPIYKNGKIIGGLRGVYLTNRLKNSMDLSSFDGMGYLNIIDDKGNFVVREAVEGNWNQQENIYDMFTIADSELEYDLAELEQEIDDHKNGIFYMNNRKGRQDVFYMPLGINNWYLMTVVPEDFLNIRTQKIERSAFFLMAKLILVFLLILLLVNAMNRNMKKQLTASKNYFENVLDQLSTPLFMTDNKRNLRFINQKAKDIWRKENGDFYGRECCDLKTEICGTENCSIKRLTELGEDTTLLHYSGRTYMVKSARIMDGFHEKQDGFVEILQDITELLKTQKEFQTLTNHVPGGVMKCQYDNWLSFDYISEGFLELIGYTREEIEDRFRDCFYHTIFVDDAKGVRDTIHRQLSRGTQIQLQYRIQNKAGEIIWLLAHGELSKDSQGKRSIFWVVVNISERKHAMEALEKKTLELETISENMSGGILITRLDEKFSITYANSGYLKMMKCTMPEALSSFALDAVVEEDVASTKKIIEEQLKYSDEVSCEHRIQNQEGEIIWVSLKGHKMVYNNGEHVGIWVIVNISELKRTEQMLRMSDEQYRIAAENSSDMIFEYYIDRKLLQHSTKKITDCYNIPSLLENAPESLLNYGIVLKETRDEFLKAFQKIQEGEEKTECLIRSCTVRGKFKWNRMTLIAIRDIDGKPTRAVGVLRDITDQKEAEIQYEREAKYRDTITKDAIAYYVVDLMNKRLIKGHERWYEYYSIPISDEYDEVLQSLVDHVVYSEDRDLLFHKLSYNNIMNEYTSGESKIEVDYRRINEDGQISWACATMYLLTEEINDLKGICYIRDINELKEKELAWRKKAELDLLTGLYNKVTAEHMIQAYLEEAAEGVMSAFYIVDLDNFKAINDRMGHAYGDAVLSEVARKLSTMFRKNDIIGRIGGDEFVVFLKNINSLEMVEQKANEICNMFHTAYIRSKDTYQISGTVGAAVLPIHGKTFEDLYHKADLALYEAKRLGKDSYFIYHDGLGVEAGGLQVHNDIDRSTDKIFSENITEYAFRILYEAQNAALAVQAVLELVTKHFRYSRGYIIERQPDKGQFINTYEWCAEGISSVLEDPEAKLILNQDCESCFNEEGIAVMFETDPKDEERQAIMHERGAKMMLHCKMGNNHGFFGLVWFDECYKASSPTRMEQEVLMMVTRVLEVFLMGSSILGNEIQSEQDRSGQP